MRTKIMLILSCLMFAGLNYGIYEKEQLIKNGETVFLELRTVDPRSIMQGDYMILNYAVEAQARQNRLTGHKKRGYMVISLDENNIGKFVRLYNDEELKNGEKLLYFHNKGWRLNIVPNSFFFQEGHAKYYDNARYGIFKFDDNGKHLLTGLADENRKEIIAPADTVNQI